MTLQDRVAEAFADAREDVYRYLLTLGLDAAQAQETAQEVFLRLYVALRDGESILNTRAWVFRVAHNMGLNLRAREKRKAPFEPALAATLRDGGGDPERRLLERERMRRLEGALEELSPQQRRCLYLRAEGLRYHEIAETIGVGVSTVGKFLSRAVARLRKAAHE